MPRERLRNGQMGSCSGTGIQTLNQNDSRSETGKEPGQPAGVLKLVCMGIPSWDNGQWKEKGKSQASV